MIAATQQAVLNFQATAALASVLVLSLAGGSMVWTMIQSRRTRKRHDMEWNEALAEIRRSAQQCPVCGYKPKVRLAEVLS